MGFFDTVKDLGSGVVDTVKDVGESIVDATGIGGVADAVGDVIKDNAEALLILDPTGATATLIGAEFIKDPGGTLDDAVAFFDEDLPGYIDQALEDLNLTDASIATDRDKLIESREESAKQREIANRFDRARTELSLKRERSRLARAQRLGVAQTQQAGQATGASGGSAVKGAVGSIRSTESVEQATITTQRAAALAAGSARDLSVGEENKSAQLAEDITFKQAEVANNRQLFLSTLGLFG